MSMTSNNPAIFGEGGPLPSAKTFLWFSAAALLVAGILLTMQLLGWPLTLENLSRAFSQSPFLTSATIIAILSVAFTIAFVLVKRQTARLEQANVLIASKTPGAARANADAMQMSTWKKVLGDEVHRAFADAKKELTSLIVRSLEHTHSEQVDLLDQTTERLMYALEAESSRLQSRADFEHMMYNDIKTIHARLNELSAAVYQIRDVSKSDLTQTEEFSNQMRAMLEQLSSQEHVKMLDSPSELKKTTASSTELSTALAEIERDLDALSEKTSDMMALMNRLLTPATEAASKLESVKEEKKKTEEPEDDAKTGSLALRFGLTEEEIERLSSRRHRTEENGDDSTS